MPVVQGMHFKETPGPQKLVLNLLMHVVSSDSWIMLLRLILIPEILEGLPY